MKFFSKKEKGFTIIEAVIAVAVFAVIATAFYFSINMVIDAAEISRRRTAATNIANEIMEEYRNFSYGEINIGVTNSYKTIDNIKYKITTFISFVDDPYDGLIPADPAPGDYKRVRIEVCWESQPTCVNPPTFISNFSTNQIETGEGMGVIKANVIDAESNPLTGASVTITRTNPPENITGFTDAEGTFFAYNVNVSQIDNDYHVEVTKEDPIYSYSTDYTVSPITVPQPSTPNPTVNEGAITELSLSVDKVSSLAVNTLNSSNPEEHIGNVSFKITGLQKLLGYDAENNPIYKYIETHATDVGGVLNFSNNLEWNVFQFELEGESANLYSITGFDMPSTGNYPPTSIDVPPATSQTLNIYLDEKTDYNVLFHVTDSTNNPISDANIHLTAAGYDENRTTTNFGQAFFRDLSPTTYNIEITKAEYLPYSGTLAVMGQEVLKVQLDQPI